jgi:putative thioredoxin
MGALPESQVTAFLERLTKGKVGAEEQDLLKAADAALGNKDYQRAAQIYQHLLDEDAGNLAALAGLARCYVATNALDKAKQMLAKVPEQKRNDAAVAAARAALDLAEQSKSIGPVNELERKVAANPADHQARFDFALALNAAGKRVEAADQLLEIVKRDRKWNEDGARKQLVQLFEAWGPADEATVAGRKKLSSILFA